MVRRVGRRDCWDCWTRVLRRSAGWRRIEVVKPEHRPAVKWNNVLEAAQDACISRVQKYGRLCRAWRTIRGSRLRLWHDVRAIILHGSSTSYEDDRLAEAVVCRCWIE